MTFTYSSSRKTSDAIQEGLNRLARLSRGLEPVGHILSEDGNTPVTVCDFRDCREWMRYNRHLLIVAQTELRYQGTVLSITTVFTGDANRNTVWETTLEDCVAVSRINVAGLLTEINNLRYSSGTRQEALARHWEIVNKLRPHSYPNPFIPESVLGQALRPFTYTYPTRVFQNIPIPFRIPTITDDYSFDRQILNPRCVRYDCQVPSLISYNHP